MVMWFPAAGKRNWSCWILSNNSMDLITCTRWYFLIYLQLNSDVAHLFDLEAKAGRGSKGKDKVAPALN
jgi:hypothetical protein